MKLPRIVTPEHTITLPLTKKVIKFRPFLVKEEKILLTAIEGFDPKSKEDSAHLTDAIFQILQACILTRGIKVDALPSVDIEFLFLNIRKRSVGEKIDILVNHSPERGGCDGYTDLEVNLNTVEVVIPEEHKSTIMITDKVGITLRDPPLKRSVEIQAESKSDIESFYGIILESIDKIFEGDEFSNAADFSKDELKEWMEQFTKKNFDDIMAFFNSTPYLTTHLTYTCKQCQQQDTVEVRGVTNFFT
jgi:hypothetical protein